MGDQADRALKVGDSVRVISGAHKGKVGTTMRVVPIQGEAKAYQTVLVSCPAGEADYIKARDLKKEKGSEQ